MNRNNKYIPASLIGTFVFCEKAAVHTCNGKEISGAAATRMAEGRKVHFGIAAKADKIRTRSRLNVFLLILVLIIIALMVLTR